jgi:hypothetical protein
MHAVGGLFVSALTSERPTSMQARTHMRCSKTLAACPQHHLLLLLPPITMATAMAGMI